MARRLDGGKERAAVEVFWCSNGQCSCADASLGMYVGLQAGDMFPIQPSSGILFDQAMFGAEVFGMTQFLGREGSVNWGRTSRREEVERDVPQGS